MPYLLMKAQFTDKGLNHSLEATFDTKAEADEAARLNRDLGEPMVDWYVVEKAEPKPAGRKVPAGAKGSAVDPRKYRTDAGWLAILLGGLGLHWAYLGERKWTLVYRSMFGIAFLLGRFGAWVMLLLFVLCWYDACVFWGMKDEKFDRLYNGHLKGEG